MAIKPEVLAKEMGVSISTAEELAADLGELANHAKAGCELVRSMLHRVADEGDTYDELLVSLQAVLCMTATILRGKGCPEHRRAAYRLMIDNTDAISLMDKLSQCAKCDDADSARRHPTEEIH